MNQGIATQLDGIPTSNISICNYKTIRNQYVSELGSNPDSNLLGLLLVN